jgi:23S rRNA pseudouridine2605 synthase
VILDGRVRLNGKICRDPDCWIDLQKDRIEVGSQHVEAAPKVYVMLNKPRGLITTVSDEHQRATVFQCLEGADLPLVSPVGRLDKASEGLLLFSNDTSWAARLTAPESLLEKIYHVQVGCVADEVLIDQMQTGMQVKEDFLTARRVSILRTASRNSWLEVELTEGKNRHIRRLLEALGVEVLRLIRVSIGPLQLGPLPKGAFRHLTDLELRALGED